MGITIPGIGRQGNRYSTNSGCGSKSVKMAGTLRAKQAIQERLLLLACGSHINMPQPSWRRISSGVGGGLISLARRSR